MKKMLENKTRAIHHNPKINYNYPYIHSKKSKNYEQIKKISRAVYKRIWVGLILFLGNLYFSDDFYFLLSSRTSY